MQAAGATADDAPTGWKYAPITMEQADGTEVTGGHAVYQASAAPSMMLVCSKSAYTVYFAQTEYDWQMQLDDASSRYLRASVATYALDDDNPERGRWAYNRKQRLMISQKSKWGIRSFNAAINQEQITLRAPKWGAMIMTPSPVDDQFKTFSEGCKELRAD